MDTSEFKFVTLQHEAARDTVQELLG